MIYTKKANFPYPILMNHTDDYNQAEFEFDIELKDTSEEYILGIDCEISSDFIKEALSKHSAELILIIKSKDNQFYNLECRPHIEMKIKKNKLCLNSKTVMQLMILSKEDIKFENNNDLNEFYEENKKDIIVSSGQALGFSNTVIFDGSQEKPYEIFEKRVDETIGSDIEVELSDETIVIVYKNPSLEFSDIQYGKEFNYPYIYLGLQKALSAFIIHANPDDIEEDVIIDEMEPPESALDLKLYTLMQAKNITELNWENIDHVIYRLTDNMIGRYTDVVRRLSNGD